MLDTGRVTTPGVPRDPRPDDIVWPTAQWPPPRTLAGAGVTLSQTGSDDSALLFAALDHDPCWEHVAGRPTDPAAYADVLAEAPASGRWPWVVRRGDEVVGTTSFLDVQLHDARLEIGHTTYSPTVWGSEVNPACKLVLMEWAFDHGFGRVQMKTDIRNLRSQRAITGLGATYEGVLRRYQRRSDGSIRDTVMFSVTAEEWPSVRERLVARLARV
jgi:N-acetyltransferase